MGQRMRPQPIPSLLEYKTIRLRDHCSPSDTDRLKKGKAASEQGQKGGLRVDAKGKSVSASSQQISPSLASYGGMHSFSQMAQFLPSICNQNIKRRPSALLPLSMPALFSGRSTEDTESTVKPFYRSSMPEAFLSASSNLINLSAPVPSYVYTGNFFYNRFGAKSSSGLECIGKSGVEFRKPKAKSEPVCTWCKQKSDTLPPIRRSHCTAHPESCSSCRKKNCSLDKNSSPEKKSVGKKISTESKRESKAVAGRRKLKRGETYGMKPKVTKPSRKSEKKVGLKTKQRQKCQPCSEARKSTGSQQKQQASLHGHQQTATHEEEEKGGISSYVQGNSIQTNTSPPSNMSNHDDETYYDLNKDEEESEHDYFHRNSSILHPPPNYLPPVTKSKVRIHRTSLLEDLGEQSDNLNTIGWARDGFLEDNALKRALLLRSRALYNTSSNNTTVPFDDTTPVCSDVLCENVHQETKDEVLEEVKNIRKSLEVSAKKSTKETQERNVPEHNDFAEKKLVLPQDIHVCSVTWQEGSPHLGPKKKKTTKSIQRSGKLNPIADIKSQSSNAAETSRHLQENRFQKLRDHTNCMSIVPEALPDEDESTAKLCIQNPPPVHPLTSLDLIISCGARTSKSFGALPSGKEATDLANLLPDAATLRTSNYPKFAKMFYKTRFPQNEQTRKEKKFEGHIDGKKVTPVGHLEIGPSECLKEE